jgi:hypothetical protein
VLASPKTCLCFCNGHRFLPFQEREEKQSELAEQANHPLHVWNVKLLQRQMLRELLMNRRSPPAMKMTIFRRGNAHSQARHC